MLFKPWLYRVIGLFMKENELIGHQLFDLDWPIDQDGYVIDTDPEGRQIVRRRGGPLRYYRPLRDHPGLAREFSELREEEDYIDFAGRFGLLGNSLDLASSTDDKELVAHWFLRSKQIRDLLGAHDNGDKKAAVKMYNETHHLLRTFVHAEETRKSRIVIQPSTLFGAMILQVADELTTGIRFKRCSNCTTWFQHRANKNFCSDQCRYAHNNKRRK